MKMQQENSTLLINLNKATKKSHELGEKNKQLNQNNMVNILKLFICINIETFLLFIRC